MRNIKPWALLFLAVFLAGCEPAISLQPLSTGDGPAFEPGLLGIWSTSEGNDSACKLEELKTGAYGLRCKPEDKPNAAAPPGAIQPAQPDTETSKGSTDEQEFGELKFEVRLVQLGNCRFLDFYPESPNAKVDFYLFHLVPGHSIAQFRLDKDELELRFLDNKWIKHMLDENKEQIEHEHAAGTVVLTASSEELQRFVTQYADDKDAFSCVFKLRRKK
jgi:hypothetical protein